VNRSQLLDRASLRALIAFLIIWAAATAYLAASGGDWIFPIAALLIFGVALSGVIWFVTRKMDAPAVPVERPQRESLALLFYVAVVERPAAGRRFHHRHAGAPVGRARPAVGALTQPAAGGGRPRCDRRAAGNVRVRPHLGLTRRLNRAPKRIWWRVTRCAPRR